MGSQEQDALLEAARPLIELAIQEDIGPGDATSLATLPAEARLCGRMVAKAAGVLAGLPVAEAVFHRIDPTVRFIPHVADGQEVVPGELLAEIAGPARSVLAGERTALNFVQRLSGIATLTRNFVDAVACTPAVILDTRKTAPGYRVLDKYAVRMGGGLNHRASLYDMILIKDNHIDAAGGILPSVARARAAYPSLPVEVEVRDLKELDQALGIAPPLDRIMLDNMSLATMRQAVALAGERVPLEASGNVTVERAGEIAATGVDCISAGALTHSAPALDVSLKIVKGEPQATGRDLAARVQAHKASMGSDLVILGHHYQRDDVIALADLTGDSLQLARQAAQTTARTIVFCGVHFMAEVAAILAKPGQTVIIPDASAGCYLADTATPEAVQAAWDRLDVALGRAEREITPITYVNSSAALKAMCGRHGGSVCTSGNAEQVLAWALSQRPRAFFFPDQHLGWNTARRLRIGPHELLVWDRHQPPEVQAIRAARVILWPGACNVHQRFRPEHVQAMRQRYPQARILVHPECRREVVELADMAGSTAAIVREVQNAAAGSQWAIGTESRLVQRLQREHPEQTIMSLADVPPFCRTMAQITVAKLAAALDALARGETTNRVVVDENTASEAQLALEQMLAAQ